MTPGHANQASAKEDAAPRKIDNPSAGKPDANADRSPRMISAPQDVANLVLMQIDAVNTKKDELTIAVKTLTDTTKQLVRAYAGHANTIAKLEDKLKALEQ